MGQHRGEQAGGRARARKDRTGGGGTGGEGPDGGMGGGSSRGALCPGFTLVLIIEFARIGTN